MHCKEPVLVRIDLHKFRLVDRPGREPSNIVEHPIWIDLSSHETQTKFFGKWAGDEYINSNLNWMAQCERDEEVLLGWRGLVPENSMERLDSNFKAARVAVAGGPDLALATSSPSPIPVLEC